MIRPVNSRMKNENIELKNLNKVLNKVDFDRSNPLWSEMGVTKADGVISGKVDDKRIGKYFKELSI